MSQTLTHVHRAESKYFADRVYGVYTVYMAVHRLYMLCGELAQMQPMWSKTPNNISLLCERKLMKLKSLFSIICGCDQNSIKEIAY